MQASHSIPYQHWVKESEELYGKFQVFYCSTKGWHWGRCEAHEFWDIWLFASIEKYSQFTSLRMEAYRNNSTVQVLGKFHVFLRWKSKVYRQLLYVTNVNNSPNLLSRDTFYTLGGIKPCYSVEAISSSSSFQGTSTSNTHTAFKVLGPVQYARWTCDSHCENEGTAMGSPNCSSKQQHCEGLIFKELHWQKWGSLMCTLTCFHWNWEVFQRTVQVPAQEKCKTCKTCTKESSNSSAGCFLWGNEEFWTTWNPRIG